MSRTNFYLSDLPLFYYIFHNYEQEDQLSVFGFSRGADIVRSRAGLIRNCSMLRREFAGSIPAAYELYRQWLPRAPRGGI